MTINTTPRHALPLPSATDLLANRTLAPLAIFDAVLRVAAAAVALDHPDLQLHPDPHWSQEPPPASLVLAAVILDKLESLGAVLHRYRAAIAAEDARALRDFPF